MAVSMSKIIKKAIKHNQEQEETLYITMNMMLDADTAKATAQTVVADILNSIGVSFDWRNKTEYVSQIAGIDETLIKWKILNINHNSTISPATTDIYDNGIHVGFASVFEASFTSFTSIVVMIWCW